MTSYERQRRYSSDSNPMSVGDWFITILVLAIPIVGLIMYLVWAFGGSGNVNRKNYCIAMLIWCVIGLALAFVLGMVGSLSIV